MKSNEFPPFPTKATGQGVPHFAENGTILAKSAQIKLFCKGAPRLGLMTCNHSENQSFGADDRKETKIEVRTNTNGPKLEQTRCHFGAKWSTSWRKIVQKWGPPFRTEVRRIWTTPLLVRGLSKPVGRRARSPPNSNMPERLRQEFLLRITVA